MPIKTTPFDAARYFGTPESQAELIKDALETGSESYVSAALETVARARAANLLKNLIDYRL